MTSPDSTTQRWSRRRMYAEIALMTDLPTPVTAGFTVNILSLDFDTLAEGMRWAEHFGVTAEPYMNEERRRRYLGVRGRIDWHGWPVQIYASDEVSPDGDLDDETTERLRALDQLRRCGECKAAVGTQHLDGCSGQFVEEWVDEPRTEGGPTR